MILAANGVSLWTMLAIFFWVEIAFWPARVAARKGLRFFLYFPDLLPDRLLVAYLVHDRGRPALT